jgi:hypothetical protein
MSDYLRKPAIGTRAREIHDQDFRRRLHAARTRVCKHCDSGRPPIDGTRTGRCLACHPDTKDHWNGYRSLVKRHTGDK